MIPLDSPTWADLKDAYGPATGIPGLLHQLRSYPVDDPDESLGSRSGAHLRIKATSTLLLSLRFPHVIETLAQDPSKATPSFFQFPAWIEICRQKSSAEVPPALADDYYAALGRIPSLVGSAAKRDWDDSLLQCALAAFAAAQGRGSTAEAILELSPEVATKFLDWFYGQ